MSLFHVTTSLIYSNRANQKIVEWCSSIFLKLGLFCIGITLLYLSFPNSKVHLSIFSWFSFVPILVIIINEPRHFLKLLWSWMFFQLFFMFLFYFRQQPLPLSFDVSNHTNGIVLFMVVFPLLYGIFFCFISYLFYWKNTLLSALVQTSLWGLFEPFIIERLMGFPLSLALTNFQNSLIIQLASIGGINSVSCVIFMSNIVIVYLLISKFNLKSSILNCLNVLSPLLCFLVILFISLFLGYFRINSVTPEGSHNFKVSLIQPNVSPYYLSLNSNNNHYFEWQLNQLFEDSFYAKSHFKPDFLLWPEGVLSDKIFTKEFYYSFRELSETLDTPLIIHSIFFDKGMAGKKSSALHFKGKSLLGINHKYRLVPIFESEGYSAGFEPNVFFDVAANVDLGSMICFEVLFSSVSRQLVAHGANVLTCLSNNGYFGKSNWPLLHGAYSVFRSVEYGRPFIFINNTGFSVVTDSVGRILHRSPLIQSRISNVSVPNLVHETFYFRNPAVFNFSCLIIVAFGAFFYGFSLFKSGGVNFLSEH